MTIDFDKAFEVENGIVLADGSYLTGGSGSPVGFAAPVGTYYFRTGTKTIWFKFDTGVNDWKQLSADDIAAMDTGEVPPTAQTTQFLLTKLLTGAASAVSQTLIFGNGGNTSAGNYLENLGVPSNVVGIPVGMLNATLRSVFLGNENIQNGTVFIQTRFPQGTGTWTTIYTLNVNNQRYVNVSGLSIAITQNAEVAVFTNVPLKNAKVVLNVNGNAS